MGLPALSVTMAGIITSPVRTFTVVTGCSPVVCWDSKDKGKVNDKDKNNSCRKRKLKTRPMTSTSVTPKTLTVYPELLPTSTWIFESRRNALSQMSFME
jgi:hypothetical protein